MKIEVAPWLRDYVVDMDDLYSELILEKIQNKSSRTFESKVSNYKELFIETDDIVRYENSLKVYTCKQDERSFTEG